MLHQYDNVASFAQDMVTSGLYGGISEEYAPYLDYERLGEMLTEDSRFLVTPVGIFECDEV